MAKQSLAVRRYARRLTVALTAYFVALLGANWTEQAWHPTGPALVVLALVPAMPIIGVLAVFGLYLLDETDEFLRHRIATSMLIGTGIMLALATMHNFLSSAGVAGLPRFWAFPVWCFAWGMAQCVLGLRDRLAGRGA